MKSLTKPVVKMAQEILGWEIIRQLPEGEIRGIITETEAYHAEDPASHSFSGKTERNKSMFLAAGHAYIYKIYGSHYCLNVVTGKTGQGEAVLIRSISITVGSELAQVNRNNRFPLTIGPGRLCQALRIDQTLDGHYLSKAPLQILPKQRSKDSRVIITPRIGVTKAASKLLRFVLE